MRNRPACHTGGVTNLWVREAALTVLTRQAAPIDWTTIQHNLASLYLDRIRGERAHKYRARDCALRVDADGAHPGGLADRLGGNPAKSRVTYSDRIRGERADNIERAIELYEMALTVHTREASPTDWAMTQQGLADAYQSRIRGESDKCAPLLTACPQAGASATGFGFPIAIEAASPRLA